MITPTRLCIDDPARIIEQREMISRLEALGHGELLEALADPAIYARSGEGRVVMTALGRKLGVGPKKARLMLNAARAALL